MTPQWRWSEIESVITVGAATRHGWTLVKSFAKNDGSPWREITVLTKRQQEMSNKLRHPSRRSGAAGKPLALPVWANDLGVGIGDELGVERIELSPGVTPHGSTLAVILDALDSAGIAEVDIRDVQCVLSQLGNLIVELHGLPDEQRQFAEPALHAEILRRCNVA